MPTGFRRKLDEVAGSVAEVVSTGNKEERRSPHFRGLLLAMLLGGDGGSGALGVSYSSPCFTALLVFRGEAWLLFGKKS